MPTTLREKLTQLETDSDLMHQIIHGGVDDIITTEGGDVPSVARALDTLETQAEGFKDDAEAAALAAASSETNAGLSETAAGNAQTAAEEAQAAAEAAALVAQSVGNAEVYDSGATYNENDLVLYSDLLFRCTTDGTSGVTPAAEASEWSLVFLASQMQYDNSVSGLTADDVQEAIDEILGSIPSVASDLTYDNADSGLAADNAQAALDELAGLNAGKLDPDGDGSGLTGLTLSQVTDAGTAAGLDRASQAQAEAGTDDATLMTPLRVADAIAALSGGGFSDLYFADSENMEEFTTAETGNDFTVPTGVTEIIVDMCGAGGSGASATFYAGGGGGSPRVVARITGLTGGDTITCTVGAGGAAVSGTLSNGNAGGTTSFGAYITITGGAGGTAGNAEGATALNPGSNGRPTIASSNVETLEISSGREYVDYNSQYDSAGRDSGAGIGGNRAAGGNINGGPGAGGSGTGAGSSASGKGGDAYIRVYYQ